MKKDQYFSLEVNLVSEAAVAVMIEALKGGLTWLKSLLPRAERRWKKAMGKPSHKPNHKPNLTKESKRDLKRTITTVEYNSSNSRRKEETAAAVAVVPKLVFEYVASPLKLVRPWEFKCHMYRCGSVSATGPP